jgi:hypothetical protein
MPITEKFVPTAGLRRNSSRPSLRVGNELRIAYPENDELRGIASAKTSRVKHVTGGFEVACGVGFQPPTLAL